MCQEDGTLLLTYYKRFIQAFKDAERLRADPAAPRNLTRPGVRPGEEIPATLREWDDTLSKPKKDKSNWGAGWIARGPCSKWMNIKVWGSWRFAFVLARLQAQVWEARDRAAGHIASSPASKKRKSFGGLKLRKAPEEKKEQSPETAAKKALRSPEKGSKMTRRRKAGDGEASTKQTTLNFAKKKKRVEEDEPWEPPPPDPKQRTLLGFMRPRCSGAQSSSCS